MARGSSVPRAGEQDVVKKSGEMIKRGVYAARAMKWKWGTTLRRRASVCIWLPGVYQAVCVSGCCGSAAGLVHVREATGQGAPKRPRGPRAVRQ
ncbi:hypothetical protein JG688_00003397 [Phytophthora aleatoria]|uniref:Uncharacterized protein n=1 Tax=Phytophthora aleatoria TaxID=2496075 RepID=A0A8J5JEW4_9STRA|nr:hypothetical protein JG688_00003397 [Phytophthora aleatoria]